MSKPRLKPLSRQVVVVTGATSGIGLATARMAVSAGAAVVLTARNAEALDSLAQELTDKGGRAIAVPADVADMAQVEKVAQAAIEHFGGFDTWANIAGAFIYGDMEDVPLEDQRRLFDVTYWGVIHGTLVAARHLKDRGGAVVNVGSVLSDRAIALQGPYSAAKFAVKAATDAFRMEFEGEGYPISVTLIKPGPIDTPYMEHARNLTGAKGTRNPPPAYHPRVVAKAILHAAEHRVRDLVVGGGGWAVSVLGRLAPRLTDLLMEKGARHMQTTDDSGRSERRDNLYEAREDLAETSSLSGPPPRKRSLLLEAQMHPFGTAGLLLGAGALLAGAAFGMYTLRRQRPMPRRLSDRALRYGRHVAHDAGDYASGLAQYLSRAAGRVGGYASDYADEAERHARPYWKRARKDSRSTWRGARHGAESLAEEARDRGAWLLGRARQSAHDLAEEASDRGDRLYRNARGYARDGADSVGGAVCNLMSAIRSALRLR